MKKKLLALLLALTMAVSLVTPAWATEPEDPAEEGTTTAAPVEETPAQPEEPVEEPAEEAPAPEELSLAEEAQVLFAQLLGLYETGDADTAGAVLACLTGDEEADLSALPEDMTLPEWDEDDWDTTLDEILTADQLEAFQDLLDAEEEEDEDEAPAPDEDIPEAPAQEETPADPEDPAQDETDTPAEPDGSADADAPEDEEPAEEEEDSGISLLSFVRSIVSRSQSEDAADMTLEDLVLWLADRHEAEDVDGMIEAFEALTFVADEEDPEEPVTPPAQEPEAPAEPQEPVETPDQPETPAESSCTCFHQSDDVAPYLHAPTCPCYIKNLTNEEAYDLWQSLGVLEQWVVRYLFSEEQWNYIQAMEELEDAEIVEDTATVDGVDVTVSGALPEGVAVNAAAIDDASTLAADGEPAPLLALDITMQDEDGNQWQPYEDDTYVALTLDLAKYDLPDGTVVTLTHIHDDEPTDYTYVVIDGKITFYTDSFSIYVVSSTTATGGTSVTAGSTYNMTVGDEKIFYYKLDNNNSSGGTIWGGNNTQKTLIGAVWSVTDESNAVTYTVYDSAYNAGSDYWTWKAQWIKITAKNAGTVIVTATCYYNTTNNGGGGSWPGSGTTPNNMTTTEKFTINVTEQSGFHIEDKIAETGCLVPVWDDSTTNTEGYTYTWTRSDGQSVKTDALTDEGYVNVSLDRGGVTNSRDPITYTVTASKDGEEDKTASFQVIYGQEILNPSFETPDLSNIGGKKYTHQQLYNGYEGLYWKTTAPGSESHLGADVELVATDNGTNAHGLQTAAAGNQFAELNAEAAGTLYQDILTTSGATFNWSFSHAARSDQDEKMYIIIGDTEHAQTITDTNKISALVTAATSGENKQIPDASTGAAGLEFTYEGGKYVIWQHTSSKNDSLRWTGISGTYTIPDGQYLTRLFFASASGSTIGNFIDAVSAGETMSYKIEYYPGGVYATGKDESGNGTVYTTVSLQNLQAYLGDGYVITSVKVNNKDYSGDIKNGLYITDYGTVDGQTENINVKITLRKKAITVTKKVTLEGWDKLTDAQRQNLVNGYTATFELYDSTNSKKDSATLTVANVGSDGTVTVMGEFTTASTLSDGTYTVKETSWGSINGYTLDSTTYSGNGTAVDGGGVSVTISNDNPTAAVTVTNHYKVGVGSLTIKKEAGTDTTIGNDETFLFHVSGGGVDMDVVITGAKSVIITGLKVGETYTVTEDTSWSWRYTPTDGKEKSVTLSATSTENTVTFTNEKNNSSWLNALASVVNTWTGNSITRDPAEGGTEQ